MVHWILGVPESGEGTGLFQIVGESTGDFSKALIYESIAGVAME